MLIYIDTYTHTQRLPSHTALGGVFVDLKSLKAVTGSVGGPGYVAASIRWGGPCVCVLVVSGVRIAFYISAPDC